jgi:hypothetical protein
VLQLVERRLLHLQNQVVHDVRHRGTRPQCQASYIGPDDKLHKAPTTFAAKIDAEGWLTDRRREIDRDLWSPAATPQQKRAKRVMGTVFEDFATKWLDTRKVKGRLLRPRTRAHYESLLKQHINPTFGRRTIRTITVEDVERWYAKTSTDKPLLRAHAYSLLRTILESARKPPHKIIESNPCVIHGAGSADRKIRPKPLTVNQLTVLVSEMPDNLQAMVLLGCWCALRFGELVERAATTSTSMTTW